VEDRSTYVKEFSALNINGWAFLVIWLLTVGIVCWLGLSMLSTDLVPTLAFFVLGFLLFLTKGFVVIAPNMAVVLTFFGKYSGSIYTDGLFWCNPLASKRTVSLRVNNFTTETIKVNDKNGNPVEVGVVISWKVSDTAKAVFAVNDFGSYVKMACESAIREVTSARVYDHSTDEADTTKTLRGDLDGVATDLVIKIENHVETAGIKIISAKITHLAYAPEIAMAMLRKQQASAVVAARKLIVTGAVGMVKDALEEIAKEKIVEFGPEQKATLVTNLLTVLVSESETQPVLSLNK
jgi:regulator of protease activity HflC (stomatin/prohibitin superfamily)